MLMLKDSGKKAAFTWLWILGLAGCGAGSKEPISTRRADVKVNAAGMIPAAGRADAEASIAAEAGEKQASVDASVDDTAEDVTALEPAVMSGAYLACFLSTAPSLDAQLREVTCSGMQLASNRPPITAQHIKEQVKVSGSAPAGEIQVVTSDEGNAAPGGVAFVFSIPRDEVKAIKSVRLALPSGSELIELTTVPATAVVDTSMSVNPEDTGIALPLPGEVGPNNQPGAGAGVALAPEERVLAANHKLVNDAYIEGQRLLESALTENKVTTLSAMVQAEISSVHDESKGRLQSRKNESLQKQQSLLDSYKVKRLGLEDELHTLALDILSKQAVKRQEVLALYGKEIERVRQRYQRQIMEKSEERERLTGEMGEKLLNLEVEREEKVAEIAVAADAEISAHSRRMRSEAEKEFAAYSSGVQSAAAAGVKSMSEIAPSTLENITRLVVREHDAAATSAP